MRLPAFFIACSLFAFTAHAQSGKGTVYAFEREVLGGANLSSPMEGSGELHAKKNSNVQYFIYWVAPPKTVAPQVSTAIIHQKKYAVTPTRVTALPVLLHNSNIGEGRNDTLIAASNKAVWKLEVKEIQGAKSDRTLAGIAQKNELVLSFRNGRKAETVVKSKIKKLEALALQ
jgi:hypothetical protein